LWCAPRPSSSIWSASAAQPAPDTWVSACATPGYWAHSATAGLLGIHTRNSRII
jgi:hypothetical protein